MNGHLNFNIAIDCMMVERIGDRSCYIGGHRFLGYKNVNNTVISNFGICCRFRIGKSAVRNQITINSFLFNPFIKKLYHLNGISFPAFP